MRVRIDTSKAGADVKETITNFPLLVRLDANNFSFSRARDDGADLRFVDQTGGTLGYEIESWNKQGESAAIWVLVPRIEANSANNRIAVYWGNSLAVAMSSGSAVFSSYLGVWHADVNPTTSGAPLPDSSGKDHAGGFGQLPDAGCVMDQARGVSPSDGIAAGAVLLDGVSGALATCFQVAVSASQGFTLSLWLDSTGSGAIASSASSPILWMDPSGHVSFAVPSKTGLSTVTSLAGYADGNWHQVVAQLSSAGQYLFIDGAPIAEDPTITTANLAQVGWSFGTGQAGSTTNNFAGRLDEIRFEQDAPSAARVRLTYETQRPDATSVVYETDP